MKKLLILGLTVLLSGCALFQEPDCQKDKTARSELAGVVHFANNSAVITKSERGIVSEAARRAINEKAKVVVYGHASHRTLTKDVLQKILVNMRISEERAIRVADALYSDGVKLEDVNTVALFDSRPVEKETTPAGEAANRRAEIYLYWPD